MFHHRYRLRIAPRLSGPLSSALLAVTFVAVGFVSTPNPAQSSTDFFGVDPVPSPGPNLSSSSVSGSGSVAAGRLVLVHRVLAQDQGDWQVDYAFKNTGAEAITLRPKDVGARVEGWLSNSRIAAHANPRLAQCSIDGQSASTAFAEVVASSEELKRCRERVALWVGSGSMPPSPPNPTPNPSLGSFGTSAQAVRNQPSALVPVTVEAGELVRVRLRFEHLHTILGDYDPLLGRRNLELRLGSTTFRDALPLDREQYLAQPKGAWPEPPDDRKDARYFVTGPDSLHLDADMPGANYFRFPERKVRYSTRMRVRFWYRIAPGTEGELHAKITQYRESPESWKVLTDGGSDLHLTTTGHWVRFDKVIRTEPEATTLAIDFRISPCDVGEAWIDDVILEPADAPNGGP